MEHVWESLEHLGQGKQKVCKKCGKRETEKIKTDPCFEVEPLVWGKSPVFAEGREYDPFRRK